MERKGNQVRKQDGGGNCRTNCAANQKNKKHLRRGFCCGGMTRRKNSAMMGGDGEGKRGTEPSQAPVWERTSTLKGP